MRKKMSKKITHEQVERVFEKIVWLTNRLANWNGDDLEYLEKEYNYLTNSQVVWNFLKQQEEQEKLLELYKELIIVKDEIITASLFNKSYNNDMEARAIDLEMQIDELEENEIEELENE